MNARQLIVLTLLALPLAVMGAAARSSAQVATPSGEFMAPYVIETTFPFEAGDRALPAGKYVIEQSTRERLIFRAASGFAYEAVILTRLAQPSTPPADAHVTFDTLNGIFYASEVWIPGHDGFLLNDSMVKFHTHVTIKATRK